jgi:plastocyanin
MRRLIAVAATLAALVLPRPAEAGGTVEIEGNKFVPKKVIATTDAITVLWHNHDDVVHTATSDGFDGTKGPSYFDTGDIPPDGGASEFLWSSGTFGYHCSVHRKTKGKIIIPMHASTATGSVGVGFRVFWANESKNVQDGFNADIEVKRPGEKKFEVFLLDQTESDAEFVPTEPGKYKFRTRLQNDVTQGVSKFSPKLTVVVEPV